MNIKYSFFIVVALTIYSIEKTTAHYWAKYYQQNPYLSGYYPPLYPISYGLPFMGYPSLEFEGARYGPQIGQSLVAQQQIEQQRIELQQIEEQQLEQQEIELQQIELQQIEQQLHAQAQQNFINAKAAQAKAQAQLFAEEQLNALEQASILGHTFPLGQMPAVEAASIQLSLGQLGQIGQGLGQSQMGPALSRIIQMGGIGGIEMGNLGGVTGIATMGELGEVGSLTGLAGFGGAGGIGLGSLGIGTGSYPMGYGGSKYGSIGYSSIMSPGRIDQAGQTPQAQFGPMPHVQFDSKPQAQVFQIPQEQFGQIPQSQVFQIPQEQFGQIPQAHVFQIPQAQYGQGIMEGEQLLEMQLGQLQMQQLGQPQMQQLGQPQIHQLGQPQRQQLGQSQFQQLEQAQGGLMEYDSLFGGKMISPALQVIYSLPKLMYSLTGGLGSRMAKDDEEEPANEIEVAMRQLPTGAEDDTLAISPSSSPNPGEQYPFDKEERFGVLRPKFHVSQMPQMSPMYPANHISPIPPMNQQSQLVPMYEKSQMSQMPHMHQMPQMSQYQQMPYSYHMPQTPHITQISQISQQPFMAPRAGGPGMPGNRPQKSNIGDYNFTSNYDFGKLFEEEE